MERIYATGRRKTATAKVTLIPNGSGKIIVNNKDIDTYFGNNPRLKAIILSPFDLVKDQKFDCSVQVLGSGKSSQAGAIRHGIARAISKMGESFHHAMKKAGFLTRDPRMVERKKPGKPKARKRFQFSKR
ncbi:MAG: 30S ribosomal protein S9 [Elusimicrobiales bacterium]|nr:30S ribosomal protein S9 [Elusimicrobiales bacterium]